MKTKIIIFQHTLNGHGEHNKTKDEIEFDADATEKEITDAYADWVWEVAGERCTWYEKEDK